MPINMAFHRGVQMNPLLNTPKKIWLNCINISVQTSRYGHPHEETLERLQEAGTEVFRKDETGAIEVRIKGDKVMISVYG